MPKKKDIHLQCTTEEEKFLRLNLLTSCSVLLERVAMNAPIQGTAADIIKLAMINVYNALKEHNLRSRLILQVHDELLVETAEDEVETVKQIMLDGMKNAVSLKVPLEVDLKEGKDWLEAH